MSKIIGIWAEDRNHLIGCDNKLPWKLPKELQHFKLTTIGHVIVMGRSTFDSIGRKEMSGREMIVLSRELEIESSTILVMRSVEEVIEWSKENDKTIFVVGGSSIYKAFEPYYDMLIKTEIDGEFTGDTYFPEIDYSTFKLINTTFVEKDHLNPYSFTINTFVKQSTVYISQAI